MFFENIVVFKYYCIDNDCIIIYNIIMNYVVFLMHLVIKHIVLYCMNDDYDVTSSVFTIIYIFYY